MTATSCGTDATSDAIAGLVHDDPAKALVMSYFRRLIADDLGEWHMLERRYPGRHTGETYLLAKTMITPHRVSRSKF
jgi:hypothetical protein